MLGECNILVDRMVLVGIPIQIRMQVGSMEYNIESTPLTQYLGPVCRLEDQKGWTDPVHEEDHRYWDALSFGDSTDRGVKFTSV